MRHTVRPFNKTLSLFYTGILGVGLLALISCAHKGAPVAPPTPLKPINTPYPSYLQNSWQIQTSISSENDLQTWDTYERWFIFSDKDNRVFFLNTDDGSLQPLKTAFKNRITALAFDGTLLVLTDQNGGVSTYNIPRAHLSENKEQLSTPLWKGHFSGEILSRPVLLESQILIRTLSGKLHSLDKQSGNILWSYEKTVPALTLHGTSAPVVSDEKIIIGFDDGELVALDQTSGRPLWKTAIAIPKGLNAIDRLVDIDAAPAFNSDTVFATAYQTRTVALASESGRILWETKASSYRDLQLDKDNLYLIDNDDRIHAIELTSGESAWQQDDLVNRQLTTPLLLGATIVVGDVEGFVHALRSDTGEVIARSQVSKTPIHTVTHIQDKVLAVASDGKITAFKLSEI